MSIDLADIKTTLETFFNVQSLGDKISESTHPMVQFYWYGAWNWLFIVPFANIAWALTLISRFIWTWAYSWNNLIWAGALYLFFDWFWLFVLDGWGWIEMDWVYQIFAPLNEDGDYGIVEEWVNVNTWSIAYTI